MMIEGERNIKDINLLTKAQVRNAELEGKLKASKEAQKYSHDNLMILERERQKGWEASLQLEETIQALRIGNTAHIKECARLREQLKGLKDALSVCSVERRSLMNEIKAGVKNNA